MRLASCSKRLRRGSSTKSRWPRFSVACTERTPFCAWQAPMPSDELVLLALSHAGIAENDPFFKTLLDRVLGSKLQRTYNVSVRAMLLAKLGAVAHKDRLAACARFLVDNQCVNG